MTITAATSPPLPPLSVVVVTGAAPLTTTSLTDLDPEAIVIAADSGCDHALAAGLRPQMLVGDNDSISPAGLEWATTHQVAVHRSPTDKDSTDTELALEHARQLGATRITLVSGGGDRLDHTLGAVAALGHPSLAACTDVDARWADHIIHVLHGPRAKRLLLMPGATFSLLALHGACTGVSVNGARWPLVDHELVPGVSRGLSNVAVAPSIDVSIATGVLTVIIPTHVALAGVSS